MCKECGNCTKEHTNTIDDAIDKVEASPIYLATRERGGYVGVILESHDIFWRNDCWST